MFNAHVRHATSPQPATFTGRLKTLFATIVLALLWASPTAAQTIRYQGVLNQNGQPASGTFAMQFKVFGVASGGSPLYLESQSVSVTNGLFSVEIGLDTPLAPNLFPDDQTTWLEITVAGQTLSPRQKCTFVPYSFFALTANTVNANNFTGTYGNELNFTNAANTYAGSGAGLTNLNAANIATGVLSNARLSGTYSSALTLSNSANVIAGDGFAITNLNAGNLAGVLADSALSGTYTGAVSFMNAANTFAGSGAGLTNLNAANIATGVLSNARTTGTNTNAADTLVLRDASGNFSAGTISATAFVGSGAGLTNLNASNITSGTLASARLSGTYSNSLTLNNPANVLAGNGSGITSLSGAAISSAIPSSALSGTYSGAVNFNNALNVYSGGGGLLTGLNASNISTGTLANTRTTGTSNNTANTLVLRDASGNFSAGGISASLVTASGFSGSGASLTNLQASSLSGGTLPDGRLSGTYTNPLAFLNAANVYWGNGSALSNLNASNITTGTLDFARFPPNGSWSINAAVDIASGTLVIDPVNAEVGIGTVSPAFTLEVNGTAGKPGGGSWSTSSDVRLKKNIQPLENSLDRLLALRGVTFEYIDPVKTNQLPGIHTGMIAQDVEQVFPEWVSTAPDGYKRLGFTGFEALTVEAMRDLRAQSERELAKRDAEIAGLQGEVGDLKSELATLRALVNCLIEGKK